VTERRESTNNENAREDGSRGFPSACESFARPTIWPDAGNSFWITLAADKPHLFTWMPVGYRIPDSANIAELCRRCMTVGDRAMYRMPDDIREEFGLTELGDEEAEAVYTAMRTAR
jgi:hypothetical protein